MQIDVQVLLSTTFAPLLRSHLTLNLERRFEIEDLTSDHTTEQTGAESNTGFTSAHAVQQAVQAGATCIGRTNTNEITRG